MFEWDPKYATGIASIDAQHQGLFAIGAELYSAMKAGKSRDRMGQILAHLISYTETHFSYEERLLKRHGYPDFAGHKALHDELTRQVKKFGQDFQNGHVAISVELMNFVENWLRQHIGKVDRGYIPLLTAKAVA